MCSLFPYFIIIIIIYHIIGENLNNFKINNFYPIGLDFITYILINKRLLIVIYLNFKLIFSLIIF